MQFTSLTFLLVFLPPAIIAYHIVPRGLKNVILLLFSLIFYSCGSNSFLVILCILTTLNVGLAWLIYKNIDKNKVLSKIMLVVGILINVSTLGYHKYWGFLINISNSILHTNIELKDVLLPLGISFYTFKAISYLVDVYTKKIEEVSFFNAAAYMTFFAQIQSGPIDRYQNFSNPRNYSGDFIAEGVVSFMKGFIKKILMADVLSQIVAEIFDATQLLSTSMAWLGAACFSMELYYDFSGYSDMAIGIGKMIGIDCKLNFDYPYLSKSISEFWRRWHISLGAWFRDYVYIPLGGSRVGRIRNCFNLFVVWFLTGLWHGAGWQFIAWGMGYFILISIEKTLDIPNRFKTGITKVLYRIFTLLIVNFQWVIFRSRSLKDGMRYIKRMIVYTKSDVSTMRTRFLLRDYIWFVIIAVIFLMPVCNMIEKKLKGKKCKVVYDVVEGIVLIALFVISVSLVVSGQNNPFLYGNF